MILDTLALVAVLFAERRSRLLKVLRLEQERLASDLGERKGEAVSKIQSRAGTPFSEIVEGPRKTDIVAAL